MSEEHETSIVHTQRYYRLLFKELTGAVHTLEREIENKQDALRDLSEKHELLQESLTGDVSLLNEVKLEIKLITDKLPLEFNDEWEETEED